MDQTDNVEKQNQLRRVLDRVRQLPILPGVGVHPDMRHAADFGGQSIDAHREMYASRSDVTLAPELPVRIAHGRPALAPWALTLTMAVSSMVVATVTTVVSLNVLQRERPQALEAASASQAPPRTQSVSGAHIESTPSTPVNRNLPELSGSEESVHPSLRASMLNVPAAHPELHDWAHIVPNAGVPEGEAGKQRAAAEPAEHRTRRRAAVRGAMEQGPQVSAGAVGDVLSGGL